jgi:hypothetical protein
LRKCMPRSEGGATAQAGTATHGAGEERRGEARRGEERQGKASSGSTTTRTRVDDAGDRRTQAAAWVARLLHSLSAPGGRAPRSKQANANANASASASARQMQQIHTRTLPRYLLPATHPILSSLRASLGPSASLARRWRRGPWSPSAGPARR